jgi:hypothetical protein
MALVQVYCCVVVLILCNINKHKYMIFCTTFFSARYFCTTFCNVYASILRQCGLGKVIIPKVGFYSRSLINVQSRHFFLFFFI